MKLPKISIKSLILINAVFVLVVSGVVWKFNLFKTKPADVSNNEVFLTYVDHGLKDEDKTKLEQKISDLENSLANDSELAKDLSQW